MTAEDTMRLLTIFGKYNKETCPCQLDPSVVTGYTTTLCYLLPFLPLPVTLTAPARLYILAVIQVQYSGVQYSTVQYSTVQYSTVQYSTVQYSTVQYNTIQYWS